MIVAGEDGGLLHTSHDGGATWTAGNSTFATWISSASSAAGDRLYAVQYGGDLLASTNYGATWAVVSNNPLVHSARGVAWEAVTTSQDGRRIAGVIQNGPLVLSSDSGATWHAATLPDAQANHWWRWIDCSSDCRVMVAVSQNQEVFRSGDYGASWQSVTLKLGNSTVAESWYRVEVSDDGQTVASVANSFGGTSGSGIYVSHDSTSTWSRGFSLVADYTFLAMSSDGQRIAATISDTGSTAGRVLLSTDGGASFTPLSVPGAITDWRAVAMSAAGDRLAAVTGGFNTQTTGLLYTAR